MIFLVLHINFYLSLETWCYGLPDFKCDTWIEVLELFGLYATILVANVNTKIDSTNNGCFS